MRCLGVRELALAFASLGFHASDTGDQPHGNCRRPGYCRRVSHTHLQGREAWSRPCREQAVFRFGADLENLMTPARFALRQRAQGLRGDYLGAATQLLAELQATRAPSLEYELILTALDEQVVSAGLTPSLSR